MFNKSAGMSPLFVTPVPAVLIMYLDLIIVPFQTLQKLFPTMPTDHGLYVCDTKLMLCRFRSSNWEMLSVARCYPDCMF